MKGEILSDKQTLFTLLNSPRELFVYKSKWHRHRVCTVTGNEANYTFKTNNRLSNENNKHDIDRIFWLRDLVRVFAFIWHCDGVDWHPSLQAQMNTPIVFREENLKIFDVKINSFSRKPDRTDGESTTVWQMCATEGNFFLAQISLFCDTAFNWCCHGKFIFSPNFG